MMRVGMMRAGMMRVHMTFVTTVGLPLASVTPPQSKSLVYVHVLLVAQLVLV
jgi:hypothetical protein